MSNNTEFPIHDVRTRAAVAKRVATLTQVMENTSPPVSERVRAAVDGRGGATEFDALALLLNDSDPTIRREAASWIDRHAQASQVPLTPGWETWFSEETSSGTLLEHLADENANVKLHLLRAYPILKFGNPVQVLPRLVGNLRVPEPEVRLAALRAIQAVGVDLASTAVDAIVELLDASEPEIREEVYRTLEWMGPDAQPALGPLLQRILSDEQDPQLHHQAALALIAQNPSPDFLREAVTSSQLSTLIQTLCEAGEVGRNLRHALGADLSDAATVQTEKSLRWLQKSDIAKLIGVTTRSITNWMKQGDLVPLKTRPKGESGQSKMYLFDLKELERFKICRESKKKNSRS